MSALIKQDVYLKMECYQPVGSFKMRGMGALCQEFVDAGRTRLFSSSGGNAGYAIAYAGNKLGAEVTVVVPETTSDEVRQAIQAEGATVQIFGRNWNDAHEEAVRLAERENGGYIHPFDHPTVWQGNASMIEEAAAQIPAPDVILVSVGGGGLLCGVMEGLQRHPPWRDVDVVAVETEGADSLKRALAAGRLIRLEQITSIAVTLGVKQVAARALEWAQTPQVTTVTVSDLQAVTACQRFIDHHRVVVEPACGAPLSLVYENHPVLQSAGSILVIVCGGFGATPALLSRWKRELQAVSKKEGDNL